MCDPCQMSGNSAKRHAISKANKERDPQINSFSSNEQFWIFQSQTKRYNF